MKTNKGDQKLFKPRIVKLMSEARITTSWGVSLTVVRNPNKAGFERLVHETGNNLRGLLSFDGRDIWLWEAMLATHSAVIEALHLERVECLYYRNGQWRGPNITDEETGLYVPAIQRITPKPPFDDDALLRQLGESIETNRTLYHVTRSANLKKIMTNGLEPKIGRRSKEWGETRPAIYFFPDMNAVENGVMNWLNNQFSESTHLTLLKVEIPSDIEIFSDAEYERHVYEPIPSQYISVMRGIL